MAFFYLLENNAILTLIFSPSDCTEASKLYITVWDKDLLSADDFLGHFLVDMGHVSLGKYNFI